MPELSSMFSQGSINLSSFYLNFFSLSRYLSFLIYSMLLTVRLNCPGRLKTLYIMTVDVALIIEL
jgi:hypothetical protein